jgi:plasmid maintenance system killer protein
MTTPHSGYSLPCRTIVVSLPYRLTHLIGTHLEVVFATRELEKRLGSDKARRKHMGDEIGRRVYQRLRELGGAPTLAALRNAPGRCHELGEDRKGQIAVTITRNHRLIFEVADEPMPRLADGGLDWNAVTKVRILEVTDYHD